MKHFGNPAVKVAGFRIFAAIPHKNKHLNYAPRYQAYRNPELEKT